MLTECPECKLQVSDKAVLCPHCGFPLRPDIQPIRQRKSNRRKRLPNGFGQISEIKGKHLRKPFRALICVGKSPTGRPICKPLKPNAYFETYNDAYAALVEYNRNPYDIDPSITMKELYALWSKSHFEKLKAESSIRSIETSWNYVSSIHDMRVIDVKARHLKGAIEEGTIIVKDVIHHPTSGVQGNIKSMLNQLLDYAVEYDIVDKNYARVFSVESDGKKDSPDNPHIPFTDDEMKLLWDNVDMPYVDLLLIQCYSGWRPQELGRIKLDDVDIKNWAFIGGMKTSAGIDRTVPIHSKIRELVKKHYEDERLFGGKYLLSCDDGYNSINGTQLTYSKYKQRFYKVVKSLGLNPDHRPHDGRVQFVTMAKKAKVDEYVIKILVGHRIKDVTEKAYTKRDLEWIRSEMEKIQ